MGFFYYRSYFQINCNENKFTISLGLVDIRYEIIWDNPVRSFLNPGFVQRNKNQRQWFPRIFLIATTIPKAPKGIDIGMGIVGVAMGITGLNWSSEYLVARNDSRLVR